MTEMTKAYIITVIIATGIYDFLVVFYLQNKFPKLPSISAEFQRIGIKAPWVFFVIGVCIGHLFLNTSMPCTP